MKTVPEIIAGILLLCWLSSSCDGGKQVFYGAGSGGSGAFGYCGDRYHQPEGNHNLLFQKDGKADLQCHLLAVPQNCGGDRPAEGGGL